MAALLLDGSVLEGGGQLLRNAVAFSALLSKPIAVDRIRHNRQPPGLKHQHAAGLRLTAEIASAGLTGGVNGSSSIEFTPGPIQLGRTISGAGPLKPTELILRGGTNAIQAPQIDYTEHVFLPFLRKRLGIDIQLDVHKRGYYPKGGGEVRVLVPSIPGPLPPVTLTDRGPIKSVTGRAYVAGLPHRLAEQMRQAALAKLAASGIPADIMNISAVRETAEDAVGSGSGIMLWADTSNGCRLAGSAIGFKGKAMTDVAEAAAEELLVNLEHGGCVDEYLQDQMIIFMALAAGRSTVRTGPLSLHTRTAIWVAEQMTSAKFHVQQEEDGQNVLLSCDGIDFTQSKTTSS